jgi:hypothetical protein
MRTDENATREYLRTLSDAQVKLIADTLTLQQDRPGARASLQMAIRELERRTKAEKK